MAMTIAQLANLGLTANQQAKLQACINIGQAIEGGTPDISGVSLSAAKTVLNFCSDLHNLETEIRNGAQYVRDSLMRAAAQATDNANPVGSL